MFGSCGSFVLSLLQIVFNPLTAGVAYIRILFFISTLSTTF